MQWLGELEGQIKLLMKRAEELQAQIDGMKTVDEREWPQRGDRYWALDPWCDLYQAAWSGCGFERRGMEIGVLFPSKEAATRERDRRALIAELRRHPKACAKGAGKVWCLAFNLADWEWFWDWNQRDDSCPASGYFSEEVDGLIEQLGTRLYLLRGA